MEIKAHNILITISARINVLINYEDACKPSIAFRENFYAVIARSEATKQSQQGSQTTSRDCFANARNDNFLMKRYTRKQGKVRNGVGSVDR